MRTYSKVTPMFWVRGTGKALKDNPAARLLALYLMTAPTSNMIGLYYIPVALIADELGMGHEEVEAALAVLASPIGDPTRGAPKPFLAWDKNTSTVLVHSMARWQLGLQPGRRLKATDKRVKGVVRLMQEVDSHMLLDMFLAAYSDSMELPEPWWKDEATTSGVYGHDTIPKPGSGSGSGTGAGAEGGVGGTPPSASARATKKEPDKRPRQSPEHPLPPSWSPNKNHIEQAKLLGLDVVAQATSFKDHADTHCRRVRNWDAAFRMWLNKSKDFAKQTDLGLPMMEELDLPEPNAEFPEFEDPFANA